MEKLKVIAVAMALCHLGRAEWCEWIMCHTDDKKDCITKSFKTIAGQDNQNARYHIFCTLNGLYCESRCRPEPDEREKDDSKRIR